jgi:LPXTG-motif cell wall-anchored protein
VRQCLKWTVRGAALVVAALVVLVGFGAMSVQAATGTRQPGRLQSTQGVSITVEVPATASPTPSAVATTGTGAGAHGGGSGNLPKTGERIALVVGFGLLLVAAGTAAVAWGRRRVVRSSG